MIHIVVIDTKKSGYVQYAQELCLLLTAGYMIVNSRASDGVFIYICIKTEARSEQIA